MVDFFGGIYEDMTTYFNTYYNAKTMFEEALSEMSTQEAELFPSKTSVAIQQSQPSGKLVNVIEKCSKILQFSKNSSYVDDALLMIGQCYFYQREYPSAMRKFTELSTAFPNSSLYLSARMWMAKTQSRMNEYESAQNSFQEVIKLAKEEDDEEILMESYLELMRMSIAREEKRKAIDYGNQFIAVSNDDEKSSQVMLQIGNLYNEMNETNNAIKSYEAVEDYSPTYKTKYQALLELAKLKRKISDYETSLDLLEDLKSESIFEEFYDRIDLEIANTLMAQNQIEKAMDIYYQLDTTFARNESGGLAQYEIAKYLEFQLNNIDSAKYFYERCAASNAPKEIVQIASKRNQHWAKRKNLWDSIDKVNQEIIKLQKFPGD
ncbi:MAG: tetratricopeptide repeat protein, partial [Ignavibacteria bacterium]|nr:tetratricopeptide repeat protein [Ignavibacteria bacterium]